MLQFRRCFWNDFRAVFHRRGSAFGWSRALNSSQDFELKNDSDFGIPGPFSFPPFPSLPETFGQKMDKISCPKMDTIACPDFGKDFLILGFSDSKMDKKSCPENGHDLVSIFGSIF